MPIQNPAFMITIAAIWINTIGIAYNYAIFAYFRLNYADFADIDDFLVAGFKSIQVLVYGILIPLFLFWLFGTRPRYYTNPIAMKLLFNACIYIIFAIFIPAFNGFMVASVADTKNERNRTALLGPSVPYEINYLDCQDGNRISLKFSGMILAEAGSFFLIKTKDGQKIIRKSAVVWMRR